MTPIIDKEKNGRQIRRIMETRGLTVQDMLVVGDRRYHPIKEPGTRPCRLLSYYRLMQECCAA